MELESLMRLGREEADEAIDGTGFLGGRVNSALSNGAASLVFGGLALASAINLLTGGGTGGWLPVWSFILPGGEAKASMWIYVICFFIGLGSVPTALRSYFLVKRKFRWSHLAGCFLRLWIGFVKICFGVSVVVVYIHYSTVLWVAGLVETVCGLLFLSSGILSFFRRFDEAQYLIEAMNFLLAADFTLIACGGEIVGVLRWLAAPLAVVFGAKFVTDLHTKIRIMKTANGYIQADYDRYKAKWAQFTRVESNALGIRAIGEEVAKCLGGNIQGDEQEEQSLPAASKSGGRRSLTEAVRKALLELSLRAGTRKPRQRYSNLGVLFRHAFMLNGYFQSVCAQWAAAPIAASASGLSGDHHACTVKRRDRAIQKLYRSYDGDATCLIDLVRTGITFDRLEDLVACLASIRKDPRVAILQVKNRLSPSFDDRQSAGYRNVALNLVLVDPETMRLGVDHHVVEVQLGLKVMDDLKNDEGHANYVRFRNARAE